MSTNDKNRLFVQAQGNDFAELKDSTLQSVDLLSTNRSNIRVTSEPVSWFADFNNVKYRRFAMPPSGKKSQGTSLCLSFVEKEGVKWLCDSDRDTAVREIGAQLGLAM